MFQAGVCSSGSITGVISGKHYNRCWLVHEAFAEALERLFFDRFLQDMPDSMKEYSKRPREVIGVPTVIYEDDVKEYLSRYQSTKCRCLNGDFGRTPQYWTEYMKLVDRQQMLHYSLNCNDYDLRMISWNASLPLCFATNHVHYSRYGKYYLQFLEHIDSTHPGAKDEIKGVGLLIRRNKLGIGQSIDLAGEQSYMRSAKTTGTIQFPNVQSHLIEIICMMLCCQLINAH